MVWIGGGAAGSVRGDAIKSGDGSIDVVVVEEVIGGD